MRLDDPSAYESDDHNDEIRGAVLVVGTGDRCGTGSLMPMNVGIGDCVLFSRYSGTMVDTEDKSLGCRASGRSARRVRGLNHPACVVVVSVPGSFEALSRSCGKLGCCDGRQSSGIMGPGAIDEATPKGLHQLLLLGDIRRYARRLHCNG